MTINKSVPLTYWNPQCRAVVREADEVWPGFSWGTYEGHDPSRARAADAMVPGYKTAAGIAKGNNLAEWLWQHRGRLNIWYLIWRGRIISRTPGKTSWRTYYPTRRAIEASPDSAYHRNHIHFSTYPETGRAYGTVWLDRLQPGVTGSESVRVVQAALGLPVTGDTDEALFAAMAAFQRSIGDAVTSRLGPLQTTLLLTRTDTWATVRTAPSGAPVPEPAPSEPTPAEPEQPAAEYRMPTSGEVYLDKLTAGQTDSDSVAYVQEWLETVLKVPLVRTGTYDAATVGAAKSFQRDVLGDAEQYSDGILGRLQTVALAKAAGADGVTVYADSKTGGQVWPEPKKPPTTTDPRPTPPDQPEPEPPPKGPAVATIRATSSNMCDDTLASSRKHPWKGRRDGYISAMASTRPHIVLLQEATKAQCADLVAGLGRSWTWWRAPDTSKDDGPLAVAWDTDVLERTGVGRVLYLPSNRQALRVPLMDERTGKAFDVVVSHLDNGSELGALRVEQAQKLGEWLPGPYSTKATEPLIFAADLNDRRKGRDPGPRAGLERAGLVFIRDAGIPVPGREFESHHGWGGLSPSSEQDWIDDMATRGMKLIEAAMVRTDRAAPIKAHRSVADHNILRLVAEL